LIYNANLCPGGKSIVHDLTKAKLFFIMDNRENLILVDLPVIVLRYVPVLFCGTSVLTVVGENNVCITVMPFPEE
jgi:hypothetical protein